MVARVINLPVMNQNIRYGAKTKTGYVNQPPDNPSEAVPGINQRAQGSMNCSVSKKIGYVNQPLHQHPSVA